VINEAEVRQMSPADRRHLARLLARMDGPPQQALQATQPEQTARAVTPASPYLADPKLRRQRRMALLVSAGCCVVLAGWIVVLAATLPRRFDAHHWRALWVNFDVFLLAAFIVTAWAIWRERQVLILLLVGLGTMLCCDAWFDVGTSLASSDLWISLVSALFAELPLAFLAFTGARRLLKATVEAGLLAAAGAQAPAIDRTRIGTRGRMDLAGPETSLRRAPLSGHGLDEALPFGGPQRHTDGPRP
jgi:hypothetical protein